MENKAEQLQDDRRWIADTISGLPRALSERSVRLL
jgi:hypothetical protein